MIDDDADALKFEGVLSCVKPSAAKVFHKARAHSKALLADADAAISDFISGKVDTSEVCFVAVGSVGRHEALSASDLDIIPITRTTSGLEKYEPHDQALREMLRSKLGVKVSNGLDLTKCTTIDSISNIDSIGGPSDNSSALTKRILVLTESKQSGGGFPIDDIRREILRAYGSQARTSGRHVLSFCNDIARYYRTLCIEYKWKADDDDADWCTRNVKLRHSRKLWYFACLLSVVSIAEQHPRGRDDYSSGEEDYLSGILNILSRSPIERLAAILAGSQPIELGRLLESFSVFLEFMSVKENRLALARVDHAERYDLNLTNPFPLLKLNSDILHKNVMDVVDALPRTTQQRIFDWFLL